MDLREYLTHRFMKALLKTPEGRAHLLNQVADAEDNGEASIFDQALSWVTDPKLKRIIDHHRSDEIRHGQLLRARRDATGAKVEPVPDHLKILDRIDAKLGGFFVPTDSQGAKATVEGLVEINTLSKEDAAHLEGEGAKITRNAAGEAVELAMVATGVELARPAK